MFLSEWREFPSAPCLAGKEAWWPLASRFFSNSARPWRASEIVSFLVGLSTYQHPGISLRVSMEAVCRLKAHTRASSISVSHLSHSLSATRRKTYHSVLLVPGWRVNGDSVFCVKRPNKHYSLLEYDVVVIGNLLRTLRSSLLPYLQGSRIIAIIIIVAICITKQQVKIVIFRFVCKTAKSNFQLRYVCLSVRTDQLCCHWTDFHESRRLRILFLKICREN